MTIKKDAEIFQSYAIIQDLRYDPDSLFLTFGCKNEIPRRADIISSPEAVLL